MVQVNGNYTSYSQPVSFRVNEENPHRSRGNSDTADTIQDGCYDCTMGIGKIIIGGLIAMQAVVSESLCCLFCGICVASIGVGSFFKGLYKAIIEGCCGRRAN